MFWTALTAVQRRALLAGGVVVLTTGAFTAGALAMRGGDPGRAEVDVETVGAALESTTTVGDTTTTAAPATTTVPETTTTSPPPPPPETTTTKPKPVPAPPASSTYTFEAPGAGTMTVKLEGGVLTVVGVTPYAGWTPETHTATGTDYVKVVFRQGNVVKWVKARLKNGEVKPETGEWTECTTTPPAGTATYELAGVGSITVTWNGASFTLDAVAPAAGWAVVAQETPGDYVRVYFGPTAGPTAQTDGGGDGTRWIKVKIHECQVQHVTN